MSKLWGGVLALASLAGCATASGGARGVVFQAKFPTSEELGALQAAPAPEAVVGDPGVPVASWTLQGPLPDRLGQEELPPASPFEALLARAAAARGAARPASLHCAARQVGLFLLAKGAAPTDDLRRFIAARCGVADEALQLAWVSGEAPAAIADERLLEQLSPALTPDLEKLLGPGKAAGGWLGREGSRAIAVVAAAQRSLTLAPVPLVPAQEQVELKGTLASRTAQVLGWVNHGPFGVRACLPDPTVRAPRFSLLCPVDKADRSAWVELSALEPGHVLGRVVLSALLWPAGAADASFARPAAAAGAGAADPGEALLAWLNATRRQAGMGPVVLVTDESARATRLAPHFFASLAGLSPASTSEFIALGLLAGWKVGGVVESGNLAAALVVGPDENPGSLLAQALSRPAGREALLDPKATKIALGLVRAGRQPAWGLLAATWRVHIQRPAQQLMLEVAERLARIRARKGLPQLKLATYLRDLLEIAAKDVASGALEPRGALAELVEEAQKRTGREIHGWFAETSRLEDLEFPPELFQEDDVQVSIHVAWFKPPGQPWGRWAVFFVQDVADPEGPVALAR